MDIRQTSVCAYLPPSVASWIKAVPYDRFLSIRELRLRSDALPMVVYANERQYLSTPLTMRDIEECFYRLCRMAVHTHQEELSQGFITTDDGFRVGVAGQAVVENGRVLTYRKITSLCLRFSRVIEGCGDALLPYISKDGILSSTLICGAPSSGKTTLLRDLARSLSENHHITVVDERREIALGGLPLCDVLEGCPKEIGILQAVRTLSPDGIVVDELGGDADWNAVAQSVWRGVSMIASAHLRTETDVRAAPMLRTLLGDGGFETVVFLPPRTQTAGMACVWKARDILENHRDCIGRVCLCGNGDSQRSSPA